MAHGLNRPPPSGSPPPDIDPDRALKWLLSAVGVGVGANLLSSVVERQPWAWMPPALFALAAVIVIPRTGLLRREPHAGTRWTRGLAVTSLLVYLGVAIWGTATAWPWTVTLTSASFLWATCVLVTWPALRSQRDLSDVALGVAGLLVGVAFLLGGVAFLRDGDTLGGVAFLLGGAAILLVGVAFLRHGDTLLGVAGLLLGVAYLLFGAALLSNHKAGHPAPLSRLKAWLTQR